MSKLVEQKREEVVAWLEARRSASNFSVEQIPFKAADHWRFEQSSGNLVHDSGKFFRVAGIRVETNFGSVGKWEQPIIVQPEIGILGIITKRIGGIRYFLMQAKMEPGNVNIIQLSPTVQATRSNYTQVHKGKLPPYLDYFLSRKKSKFLVDALQTEQGGRFLKKRNRNMIVEVDEKIELLDDFCWLTFWEMRELLSLDNLLNMDARSVLSCIPFVDGNLGDHCRVIQEEILSHRSDNGFLRDLLISMANFKNASNGMDGIISWFTELKSKYELSVEEIPLKGVSGWRRTESEISHVSEDYFSVIMVSVSAGTREVAVWDQPLFKSSSLGLVGFVCQKINGVFHFLVQAKVEPGNFDIVEMAPTVSCSNFKARSRHPDQPPFLNIFMNSSADKIKYSAVQSEEGGRFYHFQNRCMVIQLDSSEELQIPENYTWMTMGQMLELVKHSYFNVEARCLLACIGV
jgi:dTDP-4-dehydro-6-deoxy-alpha-D-glucopyranose 2,3-dehydratase